MASVRVYRKDDLEGQLVDEDNLQDFINNGYTTDEQEAIDRSTEPGGQNFTGTVTDTDTDTICGVHLYKFTMVNAGGTSDGNLSDGTLLANARIASVDRNVIKTASATIDSSSVSADEVIACFVENETNTDDINIRVQVLYHIN